MWAREISRQTTAPKEQMWNLWADVANWKSWDNTVEFSELYGDFEVGTKGMFKPVGGPKSKFVITACQPFESFANRTSLPLCKVDFTVTFAETQNEVLVTYRVEMTGFLTFFFSKVLGKQLVKGFAQGIENLIQSAES